MPDRRTFVALRVAPSALLEVDAIAARDHDGNRSAALRALLRLGLNAHKAGKR